MPRITRQTNLDPARAAARAVVYSSRAESVAAGWLHVGHRDRPGSVHALLPTPYEIRRVRDAIERPECRPETLVDPGRAYEIIDISGPRFFGYSYALVMVDWSDELAAQRRLAWTHTVTHATGKPRPHDVAFSAQFWGPDVMSILDAAPVVPPTWAPVPNLGRCNGEELEYRIRRHHAWLQSECPKRLRAHLSGPITPDVMRQHLAVCHCTTDHTDEEISDMIQRLRPRTGAA